MTVDEPNKMTGFAGLGDLVSDVSSVIEAGTEASSPEKQSETPKASEPLPNIETNYSSPSVSYAPLVGKIFIGLFILFVIWGISQSNSSKSNDYSSSYTASNTTDYNASTEASESASSYSEDIPPASIGATLTKDQVQYCVSQKIRMSLIQTKLNRYSDLEINNFNQLVDDYNSRCSHYYYREGVLVQAQADAAAHNSQLEREAQGLIDQWRQEESASAESETSTQTALLTPAAPPAPVPVAHVPKPESNHEIPDFNVPVPRETESIEPMQTDLDNTLSPDSTENE